MSRSPEDQAHYRDLLEALDSLDVEVSTWEADFLASVLEQAERDGFRLSPKQMAVIDRMKERYLP